MAPSAATASNDPFCAQCVTALGKEWLPQAAINLSDPTAVFRCLIPLIPQLAEAVRARARAAARAAQALHLRVHRLLRLRRAQGVDVSRLAICAGLAPSTGGSRADMQGQVGLPRAPGSASSAAAGEFFYFFQRAR